MLLIKIEDIGLLLSQEYKKVAHNLSANFKLNFPYLLTITTQINHT